MTCRGRVRSNVRHNTQLVATPIANAPLTPPRSLHLSPPATAPLTPPRSLHLSPPATAPPTTTPPTTAPPAIAPSTIDRPTKLPGDKSHHNNQPLIRWLDG
ncbi:hypothetical protein V6N12_065292 [Hibiscus sabdariffa]|uniref:Uncharacterized protein n=1 Tax=Hibiscus sabdariffa TaxID=183260 RepID=A0ABR2G8M1_9ROSI